MEEKKFVTKKYIKNKGQDFVIVKYKKNMINI